MQLLEGVKLSQFQSESLIQLGILRSPLVHVGLPRCIGRSDLQIPGRLELSRIWRMVN